MTSKIKPVALALGIALPVCFCSCGGKQTESNPENQVLVEVGDSVLTMQDVLKKIPHGLDEADSTRLFNSIVDSWVKGLVMKDLAEKNISDMARIERMVENYRNSLIINEYISSMSELSGANIPDADIKKYYENHKEEFLLNEPIVKGAFVRVDENDSNLPELRKWMAQFNEKSIDNIEGVGIRHATAYEYFRDTWHEWHEIAEMVPYRFLDADAFVKRNRDFETSSDGSVYLLHISEYLLSGSDMPYEVAKEKIREILLSERIAKVRNDLRADIYKRKIADGVLKPGLYDPIRGEMKKSEQKTKPE